MNNKVVGGFEEAIERGQATIKKAAKQTAQDFGKTVKSQISGNQSLSQDQGTNEQNKSQSQKMSDDQAKQYLSDLYGVNDKSSKSDQKSESHPIQEALGIPTADPNAGKTPEEVAKMQSLRNQLHQDYYQNLVNPPKAKEEPVAQKLEKEKQMEALEEREKQEKIPGALQHAKTGTAETNIGIAG